MYLNAVQRAAYELIQSDARFFYTLTIVQHKEKTIENNYIMMSQPYLGIFADGAEQWGKKVGFSSPRFNKEEKEYYSKLRQSHKVFEKPFSELLSAFIKKFQESDEYFYSIRSLREKLLGYKNVGVDVVNGKYSGNTILCALYSPIDLKDNIDVGLWLKKVSVVAGELAVFYGCIDDGPYKYRNINATYKDYHFFKKCPIGMKTELGFILFSIICSVNFVVEFIDKLFVDEIPQKLKFAYLQYYSLCKFITELNNAFGINLYLNPALENRSFRNCLAHYGLGQFMTEDDLFLNDPLKGLTMKAFNKDYYAVKKDLYYYLSELIIQITEGISLV